MCRHLIAGMLLLSLLSYPASAFAVDFASPVSYPVGTAATGLVVADFNGDGKLDLTLSNSGNGNVGILLGNGDGTFRAAVNFDAGVASPASLAMGDFNGDGKPDLAALDISLGALSVLLGNGDGSFQAPQTLALTFTPQVMLVRDFNLDGKSDLAVSGPDPTTNSATINVFLGNGDGTFQPARQTSALRLEPLAAADFNSDGKPDLATSAGDAVNIFLGNGDGTFQQGTIVSVGGGVFDFRVADVNNDSKVDLVVGSGRVTGTCAQVCVLDTDISLFLGSGRGPFGGELIIANASAEFRAGNLEPHSGSRIIGMFLGDFNGDEQLDVGYRRLHSSFTSLEGRLGKGDGSFSPVLGLGPGLSVAAVADLNSDKNGDLVVSIGDDKISVALNTSPTGGADLGIIAARAAPDPAGVGTNLTYTANVLNEGPKDSSGVKFTDTLPNGVGFASATATPGSCTQSHLVVTCDLGSLASAVDATVTIVVTLTVTGTITNSMSVSATEDDLAPANNSATQNTTVVSSFTLTVAKSGTGSGTVTSSPAGIDCGEVCSQPYASGTPISLAAAASANSIFVGWSGACTGTDPNSCTVTLNSDRSVTATFDIAPDFSLTPASTRLTVKRGGQVSENLTFGAQGGFSGSIALACSVAGPAPTPMCGISPASVKPAESATLTIDAGALVAEWKPSSAIDGGCGLLAAGLPLGMLGCVLATHFDKKRRRLRALCLLVMVATFLPTACGGGGSGDQPQAQTYTVTVTGTSGSISKTAQISVTVQ